VYLGLIAALILPLSMIALPETRDATGTIKNEGGQLSILREKFSLSQAKLAEVDPASETMRLASLGLRGIAVCSLWMQAMEQKKTENYDQLASTLKTLTKVQPNFVKVWEYQAHNLAYNVSMEFDDYEYRYHWVKKGIGFLKEGIPYNKTDHRITDWLGWFIGHKIGKSDEKASFRRMFSKDGDFHKSMADYIDPESYETRGYGYNYDNWLMAYQWYDWSRRMVDEQSMRKKSSDMLFYNNRPSQRRQQGLSLQVEFRPDESQKQVWQLAKDELEDYGRIEMANSFGIKYTLEGLYPTDLQISERRKQLDEWVPQLRRKYVEDVLAELKIPPEVMEAWRTPVDDRTEEQKIMARDVDFVLNEKNADIDYRIAKAAPADVSFKAEKIAREIEELKAKQFTINKDAETINYAFWKERCKAEASDIGILARQALFDAENARQKAIYDDEVDRDYRTKEVTVTRRGALSLYWDAFEKCKVLLTESPDLRDGVFGDEIVSEIQKYQSVLKLTGREWPNNFPLQQFIDFRATRGNPDKLPTSVELEDQTPVEESDSDRESAGDVEDSTESDEAASDGESNAGQEKQE
jgi:hypothetical protein